ncbi:hypothetical protein [Thauera sinica]|uniref:Lipoprotein n=1 Tax=Thauera sinica TaxID=2665146 RepID=A0ABW1AX67_9RHOO|nr:hypothetical protein [Thauera sp. K11]
MCIHATQESRHARRASAAGAARRLLVFAFVSMSIALLGGCSKQEEAAYAPPAPAPAEPAPAEPAAPEPPAVAPAPAPAPAEPPATVGPKPPAAALPEPPAMAPEPESPSPPPPPPPAAARPPAAANGHPPAAAIPSFPWPPPRYSAFSTIAREWVAPAAGATLGSAAARIEQAFDAAGYVERSYYRIPGGFALVSRVEHIRADATPFAPPQRWTVDAPPLREGLIDIIRALFNAPPGFYRVIAFAVTDQDFAAREQAPTSEEARRWVSGGVLRLPAEIGALPYSERHYTSALIYEFERRADRAEASVRLPSDSPGRTHLERAGLWQALAAR